MTLRVRKVFILGLVAMVFLLANIWLIVSWLDQIGLLDLARFLRKEYLTGTAITIISVLLLLLAHPRGRSWPIRQCPVCDHRVSGQARYCGECGSRI